MKQMDKVFPFHALGKWIFVGAGLLLIAVTGWFGLSTILGEDDASDFKLSFHHAIGPALASAAPPSSDEVPGVSLVVDMASMKKDPQELRGDLIQGDKSYPIKFATTTLALSANSFFSELKIKLRKDQMFHQMEEFIVVPPVSSTQLSEWFKREIARQIGFDEIGTFFPINLSANGKHIGLRYVSALPQLHSMEFSRVPYLKLFCRVSPETLQAEQSLTGAARSKIPVRPDTEWGIMAPTLGEGVTGPEFARMKELAEKNDISEKEEEELFRLLDVRYFGRYAALASIVDGNEISSLVTPPSFRFDHVSGRMRPSFQLCDSAGLVEHEDLWFKSLMKKLKVRADFHAEVEETYKRIATEDFRKMLLAPLQSLVQKRLLPSIDSTPYRYALSGPSRVEYLYASDVRKRVNHSLIRLVSAGSLQPLKSHLVRGSLQKEYERPSIKRTIVLQGESKITEDLMVTKDQTLIIEPGSHLMLASGVSIQISGGQLSIKGTEEHPIRFTSLEPSPWGALIISDGAQADLENVRIEGGSEAYRGYVRYEGALTVHNSTLRMAHSLIEDLVSFQDAKIEIEQVHFKNYFPQAFTSSGSQVLASEIKHTQLQPEHTETLLRQTPHGVPHTEREFKYTIQAAWQSQQLREAAEGLQSYLGKALSERSKWKAPGFSTDGALYRPDSKVGEFAYADIYIDTDDNVNYKNDVSYRFRYRFENKKVFENYVRTPDRPRYWPYRLEYQGKIGRGHPAPGFSEVYEARFEFRKQSLPFSEDNLAPWSPWDVETYLPLMLNGSYKNITTVSGAEVERFLSKQTGRTHFAFKPKVVVVTERLRQHLNIPTEWGSGPNPDQSNIITLDRSEVFDAAEFLEFQRRNKYGEFVRGVLQPVGIVTEMEIEFERNVSRELDKRLKLAKASGDGAEVERLSMARQAFIDDLSTLRAEIVEYFKKSNVFVTPGDQSKYIQTFELLDKAQSRMTSKEPISAKSDRVVLHSSSTDADVSELLQLLKSSVSERGQKFAFSSDQFLVVSTEDHKNSSHDQLGQGRDIQTAGYLRMTPGQSEIVVTNRSGDYCPSFESLRAVKAFLERHTTLSILLSNKPNDKCIIRELFREN